MVHWNIHVNVIEDYSWKGGESRNHKIILYTVMRIIKLNLFPVPVRLHSGSGKLIFRRYFTTFVDIYERCA